MARSERAGTVRAVARVGFGCLGALAAHAAAWSQTPPVQPPARPSPPPFAYESNETPDQPGAIWLPAAPGNFERSNRPTELPIEYVVIHDIEGSAEWAVKWFQNPMAKVSAHYTIDGTGKRIWQQVKERDIGYHAGNFPINQRSIGIEHEGFAYRPGYFNHDEYEGSARLVRDITTRYGIPRDRTRIIAHAEVPHPTDPTKIGGRSGHTDPGPYWDWDYYMTLIRNDARLTGLSVPPVIRPGEKLQVSATLVNTGDDPWPLHTGKKNAAAEARGPVFLGSTAQTLDFSYGQSALYDQPTWISPRFVGPWQGTADAAPSETATFQFTVQGPRTLGSFFEPLRLVKVPVAPRRPVPFGPQLDVRLNVVPWEIDRGTTEGFEAGGWSGKPADGRTIFWRRSTGQPDDAAKWTVPLPIDGEWEVFARWQPGRGRTHKAVYEIDAAGGTHHIAVSQRTGGGWVSLGRFRFQGDKPQATVRLYGAAPGTVVADSLRFVGPR